MLQYHENSTLALLHSNSIIKLIRENFTLEALVASSIIDEIGLHNITSYLLVGLAKDNFGQILRMAPTSYVFLITVVPTVMGQRTVRISLSTKKEAVESYHLSGYQFKPILQRWFCINPTEVMRTQATNKTLIRAGDEFHIDSYFVYVAPKYRRRGVMRQLYRVSAELLDKNAKLGIIKVTLQHYAVWRLFFQVEEAVKPPLNKADELLQAIELEKRVQDCHFFRKPTSSF
jgi:GNAT superfamily N-acetyltransferase